MHDIARQIQGRIQVFGLGRRKLQLCPSLPFCAFLSPPILPPSHSVPSPFHNWYPLFPTCIPFLLSPAPAHLSGGLWFLTCGIKTSKFYDQNSQRLLYTNHSFIFGWSKLLHDKPLVWYVVHRRHSHMSHLLQWLTSSSRDMSINYCVFIKRWPPHHCHYNFPMHFASSTECHYF